MSIFLAFYNVFEDAYSNWSNQGVARTQEQVGLALLKSENIQWNMYRGKSEILEITNVIPCCIFYS